LLELLIWCGWLPCKHRAVHALVAGADLVIACDCLNPLYTQASYAALAASVAALAGSETRIVVGYEQRGDPSQDPATDGVFGAFARHLGPGMRVQCVAKEGLMHVYMMQRVGVGARAGVGQGDER
jgi:hypothetical protein